jgi:translation elongation factor EF-Ts
MEYSQIKYELKNSATLRLLRSTNADFILSFLYRQFKHGQQISIEQSILESKLSDYIELLHDNLEVESFGRSAKEYLSDWCESKILRKTFNNSDDAIFSLTSEAEKAIAWMEELQKRDDFVGTESRFLQIFELLKEIQDRSTTDVETRIAQLEGDRDRLQVEIDKIRQTGVIDRFNPTQIQERFVNANKITAQLIADFGQVEQNFRNLTRTLHVAMLEKDSRKGTVLSQVLDANQELIESDQGKSFYAFWHYLISDTKQQELKSMIHNVYELEDLQTLTKDYPLLRKIERNLLNAATHIVQSNHRLTEKLRQMLDERNLQEHRRITELLVTVQQLALTIASNPPTEDNFWTVEGKPDIYLVMSRGLHPLTEAEAQPFLLEDFAETTTAELDAEMSDLYLQFYVDEDILKERIARALERAVAITLTDLIELYPVTKGVPEIVAYISIAAQSERHSIDYNALESIAIPSLEPEKQLNLTLPQIIFRR